MQNRYSKPMRVITETGNKSIVQKHFGNEVNINQIIARQQVTGVLGNPVFNRQTTPVFGDFSSVGTYQDALLRVQETQEQFMQLPANLRAKFRNDPQKIMDFIGDPENLKECQDMGLIPKYPQQELNLEPKKEAPAEKV